MPGYRVHLTGGAVAGGGALAGVLLSETWQAEPLTCAALIAVCLAAALFPDVDTSSKGRQIFYTILAGTDIVLMVNKHYQWAAIVGFIAMLPAIGNHRGWTHTWWAMLAVPLGICALPMVFYGYSWEQLLPFALAGILGYFSHLLLDRQFF